MGKILTPFNTKGTPMELKQIKIMARTYKIEWFEPDHAEDANVMGRHEAAWGNYRIIIAKQSKVKMETLLHEILHSIAGQTHLEDKDFIIEEGKKRCAVAFDIISEQLISVVRENNLNLMEELEVPNSKP